MKRREIIALLVSVVLVFESLLALPVFASSDNARTTVYFHEDYENYLFLSGSYGHLNESFPESENTSDAVVGTFNLSGLSYIEGNMEFNLYFSLPLAASNITEIVNEMLSSALNNSSYGESGNLSEMFQDVFEDLTNISWDSFVADLADIGLSSEENFTITVIGSNGELAERTVTVKREILGEQANLSSLMDSILENLSAMNYAGLANLWDQLTQNIQHVLFAIDNVTYYGDEITIQIEAENEVANVKEIIDEIGTVNESQLIELLQTLGYGNLSKSEEDLLKGVLGVFNFLKPLLERLLDISFVYDSTEYPSSITFDGSLVAGKERGKRRYFLRDQTIGSDTRKVLSKNPPLHENLSRARISSDGVVWTLYPAYERVTKVSGDADVVLYMDYPEAMDLINNLSLGSLLSLGYVINVTLLDLDGNGDIADEIASSEVKVNVITASPSLNMEIGNVDHVLEIGHSLALRVSASSRFLKVKSLNLSIGNYSLSELVDILELLGFDVEGLIEDLIGIEEPILLYNAYNESSHVDVTLVSPDNIKLSFKGTQAKQNILKSERAVYNITVRNTADKEDNVTITVYIQDTLYQVTPEGWNYSIDGTDGGINTYEEYGIRYVSGKLNIGGGKSRNITIAITPDPNATYGTNIKVFIYAEGERGEDQLNGAIVLSSEKRRFKIDIERPSDKDVRMGRSHTYSFVVKNIGNDVESITITAESLSNWNVELDTTSIQIYPGEERRINATITVPENVEAGTQDLLILTVTSAEGDKKTAIVVTTAVNPTIAQMVTESFDSMAETLGLTSVLGSAAGAVLLTIVLIIIFLIIVEIVRLILRKFVMLICLDRIKEVEVEGEEKFEVTVKNPTKWRMVYDIGINRESLPEGWDVSLSDEVVKLDGGGEQKIYITVRADYEVEPDGYAEIKVTAIPREKPVKKSTISLLAMVKGAYLKMNITNVFHWPSVFKEGDIITTKFSVRNDGNVTARNLSIILSVNGIEKNRVDNVSIPPGGYADVKMPWRALQGRNSIRISVVR